MCRKLFLKWVLPENRKQLDDWLYCLEIGNFIISLVFLYFFANALLVESNSLFFRHAFIALTAFIALSFSTVLQYLLALEMNSRKKVV